MALRIQTLIKRKILVTRKRKFKVNEENEEDTVEERVFGEETERRARGQERKRRNSRRSGKIGKRKD